jgi:hypothetical protein
VIYFWWILYILVGYIALVFFIAFARFTYASCKAKSRVYLKVTIPRKELRRHQEEGEMKDFRECIGVMEQLVRSLYEMQELDLMNRIHTWIWNYDNTVFEMVCKNKQVYFYVVTQERYRLLIQKKITAYYVDADIESVPRYEVSWKGKYLRMYYAFLARPFYYPIKTYKILEHDALNDLTNIFSEMKNDEQAVVQFVIDPQGRRWNKKATNIASNRFKGDTGPSWMFNNILTRFLGSLFFGFGKGNPEALAPGTSGGDHYVRMLQTDEDIWKNVGSKARQPGFRVTIRLLVIGNTYTRMREMMNSIVVTLNIFMDQGMNWFQVRRTFPWDWLNNRFMLFPFLHRLNAYYEKSCILVPEEIASLFHFPNSVYNHSPVIKWLDYSMLPPPPHLPSSGLLLGVNRYRGKKKEVYMFQKDRSRHFYILGKSGTGKSYFMGQMVKQDIQQGNGVALIDPHGDLARGLSSYVPLNRIQETIIFNPADAVRPIGLNLLEAKTPEEADMASLQATEIFIKIFGDEIFGPRLQHYFRNGCLTLMDDLSFGATLIDVPRLFMDEWYRKYCVSRVRSPVVRAFWEHEYESTAEREKREIIPYFASKFGPFITNSMMRNIIGQSQSGFDFEDIMNSGKILLIDLSKGEIGDLNTQLLGLILVAKFSMATMARSALPAEKRRPFYLFVDEFQNYATDSFATLLSEARKYGLNLVMAHQYLKQIQDTQKTSLREAVFGNVGTMMSFRVGAEDAEVLQKEFGEGVTAMDIESIARFNAYIRLNVNNSPSRVFSLQTPFTGKEGKISGRGEFLKQYSRMKYGRRQAIVDYEITERIGIDGDDFEV